MAHNTCCCCCSASSCCCGCCDYCCCSLWFVFLFLLLLTLSLCGWLCWGCDNNSGIFSSFFHPKLLYDLFVGHPPDQELLEENKFSSILIKIKAEQKQVKMSLGLHDCQLLRRTRPCQGRKSSGHVTK